MLSTVDKDDFTDKRFCECGCGTVVRRRFVNGHMARIRNPFSRLRFSGSSHYNWQGGRYIQKPGYIKIWKSDHPFAVKAYVLEHRLVMEEFLGRYLSSDEVVHHKNGIVTDNRLENLEIMHQGEHIRRHMSETDGLRVLKKME